MNRKSHLIHHKKGDIISPSYEECDDIYEECDDIESLFDDDRGTIVYGIPSSFSWRNISCNCNVIREHSLNWQKKALVCSLLLVGTTIMGAYRFTMSANLMRNGTARMINDEADISSSQWVARKKFATPLEWFEDENLIGRESGELNKNLQSEAWMDDNLHRLSHWEFQHDEWETYVANHVRYEVVQSVILNKKRPCRILEIGGGVGAFARSLLRSYPKSVSYFTSIEKSKKTMEISRIANHRNEARFHAFSASMDDSKQMRAAVAAASKLVSPNDVSPSMVDGPILYDLAILSGVLCYVNSEDLVQRTLENALRELRVGGLLLASMLPETKQAMRSCETVVPRSMLERISKVLPYDIVTTDDMSNWKTGHQEDRYLVILKKNGETTEEKSATGEPANKTAVEEKPNKTAVEEKLEQSLMAPNSNDCATFTPECEQGDVVAEKWGANVAKGYNQSTCCTTLGQLRTSIPEVFDALKENNVTCWLEGGSAIGVARHNGGQIPWDSDGDIGFLYESELPVDVVDADADGGAGDKRGDMWFSDLPLPVNMKTNEDRDLFENQIVKNLNTNNRQVNTRWRSQHLHPVKHCVQIQIFKVRTTDGKMLAHVDLFGFKRDKAPKLIDGVLRESVNYPGCFRNAKLNDEHSYYVIPPARCQFYNTTVWCPRDTLRYVENYYGKSAMSKGVTHDGFYKNYVPGAGSET